MDSEDRNRLVEKRDIIHIVILAAIAVTIGIYLIATTVLISKDGVFYVERAQQLSNDPIGVIKAHPPGYPLLILVTHKFITLFTDSTSNQIWIYSGQSVALLCRLLALIPLYFIGKLLVGGKNSFWAILILNFLPYPTRIVCDVVREWPYILFLVTGFLFLLIAAKENKWWFYGLSGVSAGLGYLIREECSQLIFYGLLWLAFSFFRSKQNINKLKLTVSLLVLLASFSLPVGPYVKCKGKIFTSDIKPIINKSSSNIHNKSNENRSGKTTESYLAETIPHDVLDALGEIFSGLGESLMWFFVPALFIGFCFHFREAIEFRERFFISILILINLIFMIFKYYCIDKHISQRWYLPLVTLTVFYIPTGLQIIGQWFKRNIMAKKTEANFPKNKLSWFHIMLIIGISICLPKLLRPVRFEKQVYRDAANWLSDNTSQDATIAIPDTRITLYANRKPLVRMGARVPDFVSYIGVILDNGSDKPIFTKKVQEVYSVQLGKKNKKLVFYEVLR